MLIYLLHRLISPPSRTLRFRTQRCPWCFTRLQLPGVHLPYRAPPASIPRVPTHSVVLGTTERTLFIQSMEMIRTAGTRTGLTAAPKATSSSSSIGPGATQPIASNPPPSSAAASTPAAIPPPASSSSSAPSASPSNGDGDGDDGDDGDQ